jgi:hypothetical protein
MKKRRSNSPSRLIEAKIKELGDWRGERILQGSSTRAWKATPGVRSISMRMTNTTVS